MTNAEKELLGTSKDVVSARQFLQIAGTSHSISTNVSPVDKAKAVARILGYRILDVCQWAKLNRPSHAQLASMSSSQLRASNLRNLVGLSLDAGFRTPIIQASRSFQNCATGLLSLLLHQIFSHLCNLLSCVLVQLRRLHKLFFGSFATIKRPRNIRR